MKMDLAAGERLAMMADLVLPKSEIKRGRGSAAAHSSTNPGMLRTGAATTTKSA